MTFFFFFLFFYSLLDYQHFKRVRRIRVAIRNAFHSGAICTICARVCIGQMHCRRVIRTDELLNQTIRDSVNVGLA